MFFHKSSDLQSTLIIKLSVLLAPARIPSLEPNVPGGACRSPGTPALGLSLTREVERYFTQRKLEGSRSTQRY